MQCACKSCILRLKPHTDPVCAMLCLQEGVSRHPDRPRVCIVVSASRRGKLGESDAGGQAGAVRT